MFYHVITVDTAAGLSVIVEYVLTDTMKPYTTENHPNLYNSRYYFIANVIIQIEAVNLFYVWVPDM